VVDVGKLDVVVYDARPEQQPAIGEPVQPFRAITSYAVPLHRDQYAIAMATSTLTPPVWPLWADQPPKANVESKGDDISWEDVADCDRMDSQVPRATVNEVAIIRTMNLPASVVRRSELIEDMQVRVIFYPASLNLCVTYNLYPLAIYPLLTTAYAN